MEVQESVFDLLTTLSKEIVSEHIPDPVLHAYYKNIYKKLRSQAYGIILKKTPVLYDDTRKKVPNDEFEYINHPPSELLVIATPNCGEEQTLRQRQLQECMDDLISSGASENQTVQNVLELFLNLIDELPSDQIPVKPNKFGFVNTDGHFTESTKRVKNKDGVTPYNVIPKELFDPGPLQRMLAQSNGAGCSDNSQSKWFTSVVFDEQPDFGAAVSRMIYKKTSGSSSQKYSYSSLSSVKELLTKPIRCHRSCMPPDQRPDSELLGPVKDMEWDKGLYVESKRRTWEHLNNVNPPKCKRWFLDGLEDGTSMTHHLLRIAEEDLNVIDTPTFVRNLKYLLKGIASDTFIFEQDHGTFHIPPNLCIDGFSPATIRAMSTDAITCGAIAHRLTETGADPPRERGQMYSALCACVRRFLLYHHAAIMSINDSASVEDILLKTSPRLKELLQCMGRLCDVVTGGAEARGSELLTRIYDHAMLHAGPPAQSYMFLSVLESCVTVYLRWLEFWLFQGVCQAGSEEFFIVQQPEFSACRSRAYWKKAFTFGSRVPDAPGFLKGLELAILETGRGIDLLRLCDPNHPLLRVMSSAARPKLSFVTNAAQLKPVQSAFESYYQTALAACGPPVSVTQLFERSMEAEIALQARVQQVFEWRMAEHALAQQEAAAERMAGQAAQMDAWRAQMRLRSELKERAAARERLLDEKIARQEAAARQRDDETREALRQELLNQHQVALEAVEVRKHVLLEELATESKGKATESQEIASEYLVMAPPSPSEASSTTPSDISDAKPSPTNESLPSPDANFNHSNLFILADNNRFNRAEDEWNQNAACDNMIVDSTSTMIRKASLTLDLQRTASDNRNRVLGAADALTKPWGIGENEAAVPQTQCELSPEEYKRLATIGSRKASAERIRERIVGVSTPPTIRPENCYENVAAKPKTHTEFSPDEYKRLAALGSRKASAERIRDRITGVSHPPNFRPENCATPGRNANESNILNVRRKSSLTLDLQLTAAANRNKVLGANDALTMPWGEDKPPSPKSQPAEITREEYKRLAALGSRKASADRIKQKITGVLQIPNIQLEISERTVPTAKEIKRKVLATEFGIGDIIPTESSRGSNVCLEPSNSDVQRRDGVQTEAMEISPAENVGVKVEYLREISNVSSTCGGVTPATAMADSDVDFLFVSTKPSRLARAYSYGPCTRYDREWEQRLTKGPNAAKLLTPSHEVSTDFETAGKLNGDLKTVDLMLKRMMIVPVRTQMKLVNDAVLKHFLVDADLLTHLQSLRNYFFLLDGEFGQAVTVLLFQRLERGTDPEDFVCPVVLSDVLGQALAATIDGDNMNARRLSFNVDNVPKQFRLSDPDALSCINLQYSVDWPLNILITPEVIDKYQVVFSFLLKLRRGSWVMNELFITMKRLAADREVRNSPQFRKAQLIRHVMTHMLYGLHNYITSTVLNESWGDLQHALKQSATLDEIYYNHVTYVKMVLFRCLLAVKGKPELFQRHLKNILILVLKFQGHLTYAGEWTKNPATGHYEHSRFKQILKVYALYQEQTASLVRLSKNLAKGQHSHLFEMMQKLSMNDFYEPKV